MLEVLGWIGSVMFAVCGVPQAWQCYKTKSAQGLSWSFLSMWVIAELCTLAYILPTAQWPLIFNYTGNLLCLGVILFYKKKELSRV